MSTEEDSMNSIHLTQNIVEYIIDRFMYDTTADVTLSTDISLDDFIFWLYENFHSENSTTPSTEMTLYNLFSTIMIEWWSYMISFDGKFIPENEWIFALLYDFESIDDKTLEELVKEQLMGYYNDYMNEIADDGFVDEEGNPTEHTFVQSMNDKPTNINESGIPEVVTDDAVNESEFFEDADVSINEEGNPEIVEETINEVPEVQVTEDNTFEEYNEEMNEKTKNYIDMMQNGPITKFHINLGEYTTELKDQLLEPLKEFFTNRVMKSELSSKLTIKFRVTGGLSNDDGSVDGGWRSITLNDDTKREQLMNLFNNTHSLVFNFRELNAEDFEYDKNNFTLPKLQLVSEIKVESIVENATKERIKSHVKKVSKAKSRTRGDRYMKEHQREIDNVLNDADFKNELLAMLNNERDNSDSAFLPFLLTHQPRECFAQRYQLFMSLINPDTNKIHEAYNDSCLVYAMRLSGVPDEILNQVKLYCSTRYVSNKMLKTIGETFRIRFKVTEWNGTRSQQVNTGNARGKGIIGYRGDDFAYEIKLNKYNKHLFIDELIDGISSYYLDHYEEIDAYCIANNKSIKDWGMIVVQKNGDGKFKISKAKGHVSSMTFIRKTVETCCVPMTYADAGVLSSDIYKYVDSANNGLEYNEELSCKNVNFRKPFKPATEQKQLVYYYADFEASTVDSEGRPLAQHIPYAVSFTERDSGVMKYKWGEDCVEEFLNELADNSVVYFHNLAYDGRFLAKYGITTAVEKGTKIFSMKLNYNNKSIKLKDSLALVQAPLCRFPSMFNLDAGKKEIYPYKYYTPENVRTNVGNISDAVELDNLEYDEFVSNIDSIPNCRIDDDHFDMSLYCQFYCNQDVNLLAKGFDVFRNGTLNDFGIDVDECLTAPSLANKFFTDCVYKKNHNLYLYSGIVADFIRGAIYGGRCMCGANTSYHTKIELSDFDACSLYPSAMRRLWTVSGKPKVMTPDMLNTEFLINHAFTEDQTAPSSERFISAYVVDIVITKVNKSLRFPLIVKREDGLNVNTNECCEMRVDNLMLEDLVKYQEIECDVVRGYYWSDRRDHTIRKVIKQVYDKRRELKKEGNPLQETYKLIMNSGYGKCIQAPIDEEIKYINYDESFRYIEKHYFEISEFYSVDKSDKVAVKKYKKINNEFSNCLFGVQVLSMSKRIMNEVMTTAEELKIPLFYQDTDSMHIERSRLSELADEFRRRYGRELIGSDMGQFHSDFDPCVKGGKTPFAVESYFICKKTYCDKLMDDDGNTSYHLRCKGIPQSSLLKVIHEQFNDEPLELYKALYEDRVLMFDLCSGRVQFKMCKDMTIHSMEGLKRKIQRPQSYGKVEMV